VDQLASPDPGKRLWEGAEGRRLLDHKYEMEHHT
jgi:hypothetical protein